MEDDAMPKKILLVDDSKTVRQQVGITLTDAGYDTVEAADGLEAIDQLKKNKDVAMIIADVNMPRMNGLEMLEKIAADKVAPGIPILMLTTEGQPDMIERARASGAKGWVVKPFKPPMLIAAVKKLAGAPA